MILYLGDSLTRGIVGWSYIKFMPKAPYKNGGLDGDTAHGALRRLKIYRRTRWYPQIDYVVVGIGTNDLLQPHLMSTGLVWRMVFGWRAGWKKWADPAGYEEVIRIILDLLLSDGKKPVLMGLPLMQLKNYPLAELFLRNDVLRKLAAEYGLPFADVCAAELQAVPEPRLDYDWGRVGAMRVIDIITMGLFHSTKDAFSKRRGLELTVDGVHFNSRSGAIAAETVRRCLEK